MKRPRILPGLLIATLLLSGFAPRGFAQDASALRYGQSLPGYVLSWETNMNNILWRQANWSLLDADAHPMLGPLIQYRDRAQRPTDQSHFIREVVDPAGRNLP